MKSAVLRRHTHLVPLLLAALAAAEGCVGLIGGDGDGEEPLSQPQSCDGAVIPVSVVPLRRLDTEQYNNTIRDLLGDPDFSAELEEAEGAITERAVRQLRDAAELAVTRSASWTREVFPCDVSGAADQACLDEMLTRFGSRAYRRPLTSDERSELQAVYDKTIAQASFQETMETVLQVMLQSPALVYMFEGGVEAGALDGMRALSDYEVATRLSYFIWNTTPDDALLEAAGRGDLATPDGLAAEASRLLADPRTEHNVQRFFSSWLQLDGGKLHNPLEETTKDATLYPQYDAELQQAMRLETEAFVRRTFFEEGGSFEKLFSANYAYVNGPLADIYGVQGPSDPSSYEWVTLDPSQRGGLLTRAAFLTVLSTANVTAPIRRGVWVMEEALCNTLGEPPPNVDNSPVEGGQAENGQVLTVRQDVDARTSPAECQSCHGVVNPIGYSFENYDAIGRWQTVEATSGLPVDASGKLTGSDVDGELENALDLSERMGRSETVRSCFAMRWSDNAIGSEEIDSCSEKHISERFAETGDMRELLLAIVKSNAFRFVNTSQESE